MIIAIKKIMENDRLSEWFVPKFGSIKVWGNLPTKLTSFWDIDNMIKEIIGFVWELISGQ